MKKLNKEQKEIIAISEDVVKMIIDMADCGGAINYLCKDKKLNFIINILLASWDLLVDASVYILFGLLVAGLLRVFLNPNSIAKHLGQGRFKSVLKSAFFGIPIPL